MLAYQLMGTDAGRVLELADQLLAEHAQELPTGVAAQTNRRNLLRWLRLTHFKTGSDRAAALAIHEAGLRLRGIATPPESQPRASLHRILVIEGGSFPSLSTIRRDIAGVAQIR